MCASLPTLRIFLSRVAPRMFEDSTTGSSNSQNYNHNSKGYQKNRNSMGAFNLVTFGGTGGDVKRKFDTLVELEHDVYSGGATTCGGVSMSMDERLRGDAVVESNTEIYGGRKERRASLPELSDQGSEEGIVQTKTTTVSYMKR